MKNIEICSCNIINEKTISKAKNELESEKNLLKLSSFFKVFGDSTRLKIINILLNNEMCVCDISAALNMTQSAISHQLKTLKNESCVKFRKEGKIVYYSLDDEHVSEIFKIGLIHIKE